MAIRLHIDSDILVYRVGFTTNEEEWPIARFRLDESVNNILDTLEFPQAPDEDIEFTMYLTGSGHESFRYKLYPEYKANRLGKPKPKWYKQLREHIQEAYITNLSKYYEADDEIAMAHTDAGEKSIIVSIDKDFNQVPGWHYNFVKKDLYNVTAADGLLSFYTQLMVGDTADNIPGLNKVGPVRAKAVIKEQANSMAIETAIAKMYKKEFGDKWLEKMTLYGQLLRLRTKRQERLWQPQINTLTEAV